MKRPHGGESRKRWAEYALSLGYTEDQLSQLNRNSIRDLVEAGPKQEDSSPAPVNDTTEVPDLDDTPEDVPEQTTTPTMDYSQFLEPGDESTPQVPTEDVPVQQASGQDPAGGVADKAPTAPTGTTVTVGDGSVSAVVIIGTYQVKDKNGHRHTVSTGDQLNAPRDVVEHGVKQGLLREL